VDDLALGQAIVAFVIVEDGHEIPVKKVKAHCARHLENFMVPRDVIVINSMPKSANGKIDKLILKNQLV
ncbi:MAG: hypothetical protein KJO69_10990, partial [Gammaproteobacteria bacterium]|nr:hypothetical protein [Gammaproteobacteria bacterium]